MREKEKLILFGLLFLIYYTLILLVDGAECIPNNVETFEVNFLSDGVEQEKSTFQLDNLNLNPLKGKHFIIIPSPIESYLVVERNSSGYIVNITGPCAALIELLSESLDFTFEYYQDYNQLPQFLEDQNQQKPGKISYFCKHENVDIMLGGFGLSEKRNRMIDYTYTVIINSMALMIPKPKSQTINYVVVIWEPFQTQVWMYLVFSLAIGVISLYGMARLFARLFRTKKKYDTKDLSIKLVDKNNASIISENIMETIRFKMAVQYIIAIIVGQGGAANSAIGNTQKLFIRFLTGAWCLTCFVLITAFSSVLVSFLTAPEPYKPIINSVNDLPIKRDVQVTVTKGFFADIIFRNAVNDDKSASILKFLGKELERHPENRCVKTEQCVNQVRKGSSVFIYNENIVRNTIIEDWKRTGKCDFTIAKETFLMVLTSGVLLKKNSVYTEFLNREFMKMEAAGLIDNLINHFNNDDSCLKKIDREISSKKVGNEKKSLTLKSLSGAFVILGIGYGLAILTFIIENCYSHIKKNTKCHTFNRKLTIQAN